MTPPEMILTPDQEILVEKILKFLKSDEKYFRIIGRAGSGKTTAIKFALKRLLEEDGPNPQGMPNVAGIALAHKAKNVLGKTSIPFVRTFASAYGFKEHFNKETGERTFEPATYFEEPPIGHLDIPVFVHDEVSQYSASMLKIVMDKTSIFSKVIFMGDRAQLPPIDKNMPIDADSPVFDIPLPESCQHELKERIRQKAGNPILELSDIIIEEIFGRQNLNRVIMEILKPKLYDGKGYLCVPKQTLYTSYVDGGNFLENKIIAFRKDCVKQVNIDIRNMIFPNARETLVKGDLVFMTNNFKSEQPFYKLNNADEFITGDVNVFNVVAANADQEIECYYGKVDTGFVNSFVVTPTENGMYYYEQNLERLRAHANFNKGLWKKVYEFTDSFCDFTMGYGINAYRCQGSTYQNVFIDLVDILTTRPLTPKRKLQTIYTALTRATDTANFIKP